MKENQIIINEELKPKFWIQLCPTFEGNLDGHHFSSDFSKNKLYPVYKTKTEFVSGRNFDKKLVESLLTISDKKKFIWVNEIWFDITIAKGLEGLEDVKI